MFRFLLIYIFLLNTHVLKAQTNLVPNPSFEEFNQCPTSGAFTVLDWYEIYDTPDYYNLCAGGDFDASNWIGNQIPYFGNGYIGAGLFVINSLTAREAFQVKLKSPLIQGIEYCASMYVSLADGCQYAISNIGMHFGNIDFSNIVMDTSVIFNLQAQIYNSSENILSDKINWMKIEGSFIASGGEEYLTIGNFSRPEEMDTLSLPDYSNYGLGLAYYYFDEVEVKFCKEPVVKYTIPNMVTLNDDGVNDVFFIQQENITSYTLDIYNRWGSKVGFVSDASPFWDGKSNGKKVSAGIYFYDFIYTTILGETLHESGFIYVF